MTSHMTTPKGWYPDPSDPSRQRYFDGNKWTENYAPFGPPAPGIGQPAKTGMSQGIQIGLGVGMAVFVLIVLIVIGNDIIGSNEKSAETKSNLTTPTSSIADKPTVTRATPHSEVAAPVGSIVRDGKFEFQVLGVDRLATKEGLLPQEQPKGEFFIVQLRVANIGDGAHSFGAGFQRLIVDGNKYDATVSMADENWLEDINPGLSIEASLTFDIPRGAVPESIEVHDSMFSGGALLAV